MFQRYAPNEFHADYLSYRLIKAKRIADKWWFYIASGVFVITWISFFVKREETNNFMDRLADKITQWLFSGGDPTRVIVGFALFIFFLNVLPTLIYYVRKYWIYPKDSMHLQSYLAVQYKETVKLPRGRNSKTPRLHYVHVAHPVSGKVVPVEVSEDWYLHLEAGNRVHAHYHPGTDNVLYLIKS